MSYLVNSEVNDGQTNWIKSHSSVRPWPRRNRNESDELFTGEFNDVQTNVIKGTITFVCPSMIVTERDGKWRQILRYGGKNARRTIHELTIKQDISPPGATGLHST